MSNKELIEKAYWRAKDCFEERQVTTANERIDLLNKLEQTIRRQQSKIMEALYLDLNKSPHEAFMAEIGLVLVRSDILKKI